MPFFSYRDAAGISVVGLLITVPLALAGLPFAFPLGLLGLLIASVWAANR